MLEIANEQNLKIDYSFKGFSSRELDNEISAIQAISKGQSHEEVATILGKFPFRMREVEFLIKEGYKFEVDSTMQVIHFIKP